MDEVEMLTFMALNFNKLEIIIMHYAYVMKDHIMLCREDTMCFMIVAF